MRKGLIAVGLSAAVLVATSSAASAGWYRHGYHRGPGPVLGLVGGLVVGVATIATLPFAILGAAVSPAPPPPPPPPAYYGPPQQQGYYGPPPRQGYYGPPPQQGYYGPQPQQQGYYGPPPGYSGY
jgi:hypothetical protein